MGTRSTIHFSNRTGRHLVSIYTQYDGYYEGVGQEIYDFFSNKENYGNGFEDTALLFVAKYKGNSAYNKYLTFENDVQEYNCYITEGEKGELIFSITKEVFVDKFDDIAILKTLRYGDLKEFAKELNTEIPDERKIKIEGD